MGGRVPHRLISARLLRILRSYVESYRTLPYGLRTAKDYKGPEKVFFRGKRNPFSFHSILQDSAGGGLESERITCNPRGFRRRGTGILEDYL